jgi:hypothetical protein
MKTLSFDSNMEKEKPNYDEFLKAYRLAYPDFPKQKQFKAAQDEWNTVKKDAGEFAKSMKYVKLI